MNPVFISGRNRFMVISFGLFIGLACVAGFRARETAGTDVLDGNFWKTQSLVEVLPWWTRAAVDREEGAFHTYLDRQWRPGSNSEKFPSMISRNIFGYAAAYLMTGEENYLQIARNTVDFLLKHAWDEEFGGWYDILDRNGSPLARTKDSFIQVYAITGLVMYYIVSGDLEVLRYIERANQILESRTWDKESGGYVKGLDRNLDVKFNIKDFASQAAPVSGYLLYLYLATGETIVKASRSEDEDGLA